MLITNMPVLESFKSETDNQNVETTLKHLHKNLNETAYEVLTLLEVAQICTGVGDNDLSISPDLIRLLRITEEKTKGIIINLDNLERYIWNLKNG